MINVRRKPSAVFVLLMFSISVVAIAPRLGLSVPQAHAVTPKALINGDTVSGSPSIEEQQATALGFSVTVVSGATWDNMTQAQFAAYQVLIVGDPTCSGLALSVTSNAATWAPVVMGTAVNTLPGNRILIGTDPVYHYTSGHPGALKLIHDGIDFAGLLSSRTGIYFDMSCFDNGQGLSTLNMLSVGASSWTENTSPPCGGSVSLIASNPAFADLNSGDLQGWFCSDHETFPQFRDDWNPLAIATDTPTHPVCGIDHDTNATVCGEPYIFVAGSGIVVIAPNISLSPTNATNPPFTDHTVIANVTKSGSPLSGQLVSFTVTGQNNGATGVCAPSSCQTSATGQVSFTYHDTNGPGDDTITASFTDSSGTKQQATAFKHWVGIFPPPVSIHVSKFFTDSSRQPLPLDSSGNPSVNVVLERSFVRSTNPGQVLAWVNVTNTGTVPIQSLKLNETLPVDWTVNPPWLPGKGAIHVYYANTTSLATNPEITKPSTITVTTGNPQTVLVAIPSLNATGIDHPLMPGQSILLSVKLSYGLVMTSQSPTSYPRNYTDTASAAAWTLPSYTGTETSATGTGFFIAYANVVDTLPLVLGRLSVRVNVYSGSMIE